MANFPWFKPVRLKINVDRQIEDAFSELIDVPWGRVFSAGNWQPAMDVFETDDAYLIEADLPGVAPENVDLKVEGNRLTIHGTREALTWKRSERTLLIERARGEFRRELQFDQPLDVEHLEFHVERGILRVRLPKRKGTQ